MWLVSIRSLFFVLSAVTFVLQATGSIAAPVSVQVLSAVIKDKVISGASVTLQKNGARSITATTGPDGKAVLNPEFDDTEDAVIIVKNTGHSNLVAKCPCKNMVYAISPIMKSLDGLRVVLNWGESPWDLDSHLIFPNNHIYFMTREGGDYQSELSNPDANLDVDDMHSFGPETITIEKKHAGEAYVYAVQDFTHLEKPDSKALSNSNAKVLVYIGQSLIRSYYVPKNLKGNLWMVFRITPEGEFQDINRLEGVTSTRMEKSIDDYRTAQVDAPVVSGVAQGNAKSLNKAGEGAYHAGDLEQAVELYRQSIDLDSNYGQAYSNLGLAYQKMGRTAEAIWANRKAIALAHGKTAPTVRASSYYNIGKIYEAAGQCNDALAQYRSAKHEKTNPVYDKAIERVTGLCR